MKTYLINYADKSHYQAQKINSHTGKTIGGFDQVIEHSINDLDDSFKQKNNHILSQRRGAGYWLWKPYIILKTLEKIDNEDILFYCDSGVEFISSAQPLIDLCNKNTKGVLCFHLEPVETNKEVLQTKKDAFILMDCNEEKYVETWPRIGSFSVWKKNDFSLSVIKDWLKYCEDERIITDLPNTCESEDIRHVSHRHDQSVFSIITKKYNIESYTDPTQWGNPFRKQEDGYGQIMNHTRYNM